MATYQRKRETVEAERFTAEHGAQLAEVPHLPPGLLARIRKGEHGGFTLDGAPISFGDYVVAGRKGTPRVVRGADFDAAFDRLMREPPQEVVEGEANRALAQVVTDALDHVAELAKVDRVAVIEALPALAPAIANILRKRNAPPQPTQGEKGQRGRVVTGPATTAPTERPVTGFRTPREGGDPASPDVGDES